MNAKFVSGLLCAFLLCPLANSVVASEAVLHQINKIEVIVPTADIKPAQWHYSVTNPGTGWTAQNFDDAAWPEGWSGFGTSGTPGSVPNTVWNTDDIWLRRTFTMPAGNFTNLQFYVHHDEDVEIYINGVLAAKEAGFLTGYEPLEILPAALKFLAGGNQITMAVHCHQTVGGQYVDVGICEILGVPEPYPKLSGGSFSGPTVPESPDPLVAYRWPNPKASDDLEMYTLRPVTLQSDMPRAFSHLNSLTGEHPDVTVNGTGSIRMDFGQENAGWLEFDSPDLDGNVEMSISEYNEPATEMAGPANPKKTKAPRKYGHTYRLELNRELYEGVRFGWIHVRSFNKPWHITGLRLICQIKPSNYTGSFSCSDPELTRIWYAGVYTVKLNLLKDYFGAVLMDRGDRISWTGDAYIAQGATLAALGDNFDFVKTNLAKTANDANGIASYSLYWVLSLLDYYDYSGDDAMLAQYLANACGKLDAAYDHYEHPPDLTFYGWDERLGAGFANPNLPESRHAYAMLSIHAWRGFARAMEQHGRLDLCKKYQRYADEKITQLRNNPAWPAKFGPHAAADAIDAGFTSPAEQSSLLADGLSDRIQRLSYSPFNELFIIEALSAMGRTDDALSTVNDCWGGQLRYGGTTFFEVYDPSWNNFLGKNDAVPNDQCGYTSLCHPWSAGVVRWLTEETLGIKPASPGFRTYTICPHLGRTLTQVSGQVKTPRGIIAASFDTAKGKCALSAPAGTEGEFYIPKAEKVIQSIRINGKVVWEKVRSEDHSQMAPGIGGIYDEDDFIRLTCVQPGEYAMDISYRGVTPAAQEADWDYAIKRVKEDASTQGNWGSKYGHDGFVLCNYDEVNGKLADRQQLPDYVSAVNYSLNANVCWQTGTVDPRAPAPNAADGFPRNVGALYTQDPQGGFQTMTVDINLTNSKPCQISLYFVDWDKKDRRLAVEAFDRKTLRRVAPVQMVRDFTGGKYLIYRYNQSVRFRIDQVRGDNATLSGIFFD
jgi:alpha-L-rhamnosidase